MKILVVDDVKTMVRIVRKILKQIGYEDVDEAFDGQSAYEKTRSTRYDLIISDWNMEPMTGFELLRNVRANPDTAATPFILVTAEAKADNLAAARSAGVTGYLIKPFNEKTLKEQIDQALSTVPG
jgi:two-component system chemotaxis response regulator CheY